MSIRVDPHESQGARFPWYLLWVSGAVTLAAVNVSEFRNTGNVGSIVLALAWIFWAFSWYTKPFHINFRAHASKAVVIGSLRPWVPVSLWNFATFGAFALIIVGLILKFTNAA